MTTGSLRGRDDGALSDRAQPLFAVFDRVDLTLTDGLSPPDALRESSSDKKRSDRRLQIVDLEFRGERIAAERHPPRERDRVVRKVTDHASVDEAVLLLQMVNDRDAQFCVSGP